MQDLSPLTIIVRGKHDTGKTTAAQFVKMFLEENGYEKIVIRDIDPLPAGEKDEFMRRFLRNRVRPVVIRVELDDGLSSDGREAEVFKRTEAFFDAIDDKDLNRIKSSLTADKFLHFLELAEMFARGA